MEDFLNTKTVKMDMCVHRRLRIEQQLNEHLLQQVHLSNLHARRQQEKLFQRKLTHLRTSIDQIRPYGDDDENVNESNLMIPACFTRIQNHFRLLNFSSEAQKRLLCQAPSYGRSTQQRVHPLPRLVPRKSANALELCNQRRLLYQSRLPAHYSCRSTTNSQFPPVHYPDEDVFQPYLTQHVCDEHRRQRERDERKTDLLKDFDELKHTIDDPHSTLSVLAALSRAILFFDCRTE